MNKKNNKFLIWLAIGAALIFVANKKSNAEPVADTTAAAGDPNAEYIAPENVPPEMSRTYPGIAT